MWYIGTFILGAFCGILGVSVIILVILFYNKDDRREPMVD